MGLAVDEDLSPALMRKAVPLAAKLPSFASAASSVNDTLEVQLTTKRLERLAERIGTERVAERDATVAQWAALTVPQKLKAPPGVKAPSVVCVSCDNGRIQRCDLPEDAKSHWSETKVGALMELEATSSIEDPCPQVPDKFLDLAAMETVTREIKSGIPKGTRFERQKATKSDDSPAVPPPANVQEAPVATVRQPVIAKPPNVLSREVVASLANGSVFGRLLAARAWGLGFAGATRKAFIGDGSSTNWGIWEREFKYQKYIPILDFIHALTYVFSAAMAGRSRDEGKATYIRWITWVWQGQVILVIAELAARAVEIGSPPPDVADSDPRQIVAETLTYLTNQQSRMNYASYRQVGLPITSSHIESTVKQINQRVKGSEKFWAQMGAEALLQLRADQLSDTDPLQIFWIHREKAATGTRRPHARKTNAAS